MKKKGNVWRVLYKLGVTLAYVAMIVVLCWQALTPGSESSDISNSVGDKLDDVITEIQKPEAERVDVEDLTIDGILISGKTVSFEGLELLASSNGKLQCTVLPENATNKALGYESSNTAVAEVKSDGTVVAKKAGEATITVTSQEKPSLVKTVSFSVIEIAITGFELSASKTTIYQGDSLGIDVSYSPFNTTERGLTWTSSNTSVLTVSSGRVKGVGVGTATVTATSKANGELTHSITITVEEKPVVPTVPVTAVTLDHGGVGYIGGSDRIACTVTPSNATNKSVVWSSSDTELATVAQNGTVTYLKAGTVTITAKSASYDLEDSVTIVIKEVLSKTIVLEMQELSATETGYSLKVATSASVTATLDENATVLDILFTSSDPEIAKIGQDGVIEAVKAGTVTITVSTSYEDETTSESFELTVVGPSFSDRFENFSHWVRKSFGHFGAFLLLGIAAALTYHTWLPKSSKGKMLAFVVCLVMGFAVAGLTEILQMPIFTQGRGPSFSDVILDFRGYCCSSMVIYTWLILWSFIKDLFKAHKMV